MPITKTQPMDGYKPEYKEPYLLRVGKTINELFSQLEWNLDPWNPDAFLRTPMPRCVVCASCGKDCFYDFMKLTMKMHESSLSRTQEFHLRYDDVNAALCLSPDRPGGVLIMAVGDCCARTHLRNCTDSNSEMSVFAEMYQKLRTKAGAERYLNVRLYREVFAIMLRPTERVVNMREPTKTCGWIEE